MGQRNQADRHLRRSIGSILDIMRLLGVLAAVVLFLATLPSRAEDNPVTVGGPFSLIASDGTTVTDATYRGKWLLVYFGYTFCPDACPTTLSQITLALQKLGADAPKVQVIFISLDPARDSPKLMGEYTAAFDPRIVGLTGSAEQIAAVSKEYGAYALQRDGGSVAGDYLLDHSTYMYIMDPEGKFVIGLDSGSTSDDIADTLRETMTQSGD